jgi:hypothetical protein
MKPQLLTLVLILIANLAYSQTVISGSVSDHKGELLPGANVYLENTYSGSSTDAEGKFSFSHTTTGDYILIVEFIGFDDYKDSIALNSNPIKIEIELKEAFNQLNAVTVSAGNYGSGEGEKVVVMSSLDVVTTAGALGDVTGAMQTLPGTTTNGRSGKLFVHGGTGNETGTYIDGVYVAKPYTSSAPNMAVRGRFNPFMFNGTAFSTGGYSAEFGQALSSILSLNTNDMPVEESLNFSIMSVGADAAGTKMWKSGAVTASLNYINLKPYMELAPQNYQWNKQPEALGGAISFRQKTAKNGLLKVYATADQSNLSQYLPGQDENRSASPLDLTNNNLYVNTSWRGMINPKWVVKTGGSYTYNKDIYQNQSDQLTELLNAAHLKATAKHEFNERIHLLVGSEYFYKSFAQQYSSSEFSGDSLIQYTDNKGVAFAELEVFTSSRFVINGGLRIEYSGFLNKATISPRLSSAYQFNDDSQISLAYGWFYQDPINTLMLNNPSLSDERSDHLMLSYNKGWNGRILRIESYYKSYKNLVKYETDGFSRYNFSNNGNGYAAGVDVFWRDNKSIKNGQYWISYSFLKSERNFIDYPSAAVPTFVSTLTLSLVYKHWIQKLRSQLSATFQYGSPLAYNNPNNNEFNNGRLPSFKTLNMSWSYLFRQHVIFHFSVSNIPGFNNVYGYNYAPIPNQEGVFQSSEILPAAKRFFFIGCFITLSKKGEMNQLEKINN